MITHGNKQISEIVYARKSSEGGGAVRLTNIIRGAQVVFGGLSPSPSSKLLNGTTMAAILAAFGQTDGKAVIKATNAYLNVLAATDPTKASALAGFINEDPMLVCSLGLQPQGVQMPIRWLATYNKADIHTLNIPASGDFVMEFKINWKPNGSRQLMGYQDETFNEFFEIAKDNKYGSASHRNATVTPHAGDIVRWERIGNVVYIYVNDTLVIRENNTSRSGINRLYTLIRWENIPLSNGSGYNYFNANIVGSCIELQPFQLGEARTADKVSTGVAQAVGANGMIDTLTGTFYPNANTQGSFSIAYTLPDGTPWTPLNQTP